MLFLGLTLQRQVYETTGGRSGGDCLPQAPLEADQHIPRQQAPPQAAERQDRCSGGCRERARGQQRKTAWLHVPAGPAVLPVGFFTSA